MEKYFLFSAFLLEKIDANIALHKNWRQPVYTVEYKFMWRPLNLHNLYKSIASFCLYRVSPCHSGNNVQNQIGFSAITSVYVDYRGWIFLCEDASVSW